MTMWVGLLILPSDRRVLDLFSEHNLLTSTYVGGPMSSEEWFKSDWYDYNIPIICRCRCWAAHVHTMLPSSPCFCEGY